MNKIDDCQTLDELRQYSMMDLAALYSRLTKTHAPKFSDKGAAAKRILPMLQQKRQEVSKTTKVRGRPAGQLDQRIYVFNFDQFNLKYKQMAPQARMILRSLEDRGIMRISEQDLKVAVQVKTKQDPWRIFQYYRPKMISLGIIRMENQHEKMA